MLKLEDMASFVAVAEVGSISAAARRGGWSKSVDSSRLAALEEDLGARLFHRTTRRLSLTEDGAAFLVRARRLVQDVDEAVADMAERRGELAGPMRLSAPSPSGAPTWGRRSTPFWPGTPPLR